MAGRFFGQGGAGSGGGGGTPLGTNFLVLVKTGLRATVKLTARVATQAAGLTARIGPVSVSIREATGLAVSRITAAGTARVAQSVGFVASTRASGSSVKPQQIGAAKITQLETDLVRRVGGNAVSEEALNTRTDWANDANAINGTNGLHQGTQAGSASIAGDITANRGGRLILNYANNANKSPMAITSADLHFYWQSVFAAADIRTSVHLRWRKVSGGAWTTLKTIDRAAIPPAAAEDHLTSPDTFSVAVNSWAEYDLIETCIEMTSGALGNGTTIYCDATEVALVATVTDSL